MDRGRRGWRNIAGKGAVKKASHFLFGAVVIGTVAAPIVYLAFIWFCYFSMDQGWTMPEFFNPYSNPPKTELLVLVICVLAGLLSFNILLAHFLGLWNLKKWRLLIHPILSLVYAVLTVAVLFVGRLLISCSFGDCL
jgi:hypothetical protein